MKKLALLFVLASCSGAETSPPPAAPTTASSRPVIARIEMRGKSVSIVGLGGDIRVSTDKGELTLDQLRAEDPELFGIVTSGRAYLDASRLDGSLGL